jgi:hypothetical protein
LLGNGTVNESAAVNKHATMENSVFGTTVDELLKTVSSTWSLPSLYSENQLDKTLSLRLELAAMQF